MHKVLYLKVPNEIRYLHKSVKGKKMFKGVWGSYGLKDYIPGFDFSLIVLTEDDWCNNQKLLDQVSKQTKIVVLSDDLTVLEKSDAIILSNKVLKSKTLEINLETNPIGLYLWTLDTEIATSCIKCSDVILGSSYQCASCGTSHVEIAQAKHLLK